MTLNDNRDLDYFENIDTPNKGRVFGWMLADGSVRPTEDKFEMCLNEKEVETLQFIKSEMKIGHKISFLPTINACRMVVHGKKYKEDLIKHGCVPQKSLILEAPKDIPTEIIPSVIQGYFEGDGCVYKRQGKYISINLVGTSEFLDWVQENIDIPFYKRKTGNPESNTYILMLHKREHVIAFYNYIYENAETWLPRKKEIFEEVLELPN